MAQVNPEQANYLMGYYSEWLGLPSNFLQSITRAESSYDPDSGFYRNICNGYSCGLMQLNKRTALPDLKRAFNMDIDPFDPIISIIGGAALTYLNRRYIEIKTGYTPDLETLIVAYNGGWAAGRQYMYYGTGPAESMNYLPIVLGYMGY